MNVLQRGQLEKVHSLVDSLYRGVRKTVTDLSLGCAILAASCGRLLEDAPHEAES